MRHLDEHTIELYVLGSDLVKDHTGEIEAHLKECHGCKLIADQMEAFYENAESELETLERTTAEPNKAIIKRRSELDFANETYTSPVRPVEKRYLAKFLFFVYRHPVPSAIGGIVLVFIMAGIMNYAFKNKSLDTNPVKYDYATDQNMLLIYNKTNEVILKELSDRLKGTREHESEYRVRYTDIMDLDNNGTNEIVTTLRFYDDLNNPLRSLRIIYNGTRTTEYVNTFNNVHFKYLNRNYYSPSFSADAFLIGDFINDGNKEILLTVNHQVYSPSFITLIDANRKEVGKFWHFGHISSINTIDVNNDGADEIVVCGQNNTLDTVGGSYPMVIVLDPRKIIGNLKSTTCPGFEWDYSNAELFYIRFPLTDMDTILGTNPIILFMQKEGSGRIFFYWMSMKIDKPMFDFRFHFTTDMKILDVKTSPNIEEVYSNLVKEGKLKGALNAYYLQNMKKSVQYWDGQTWQNEWTEVKHDEFKHSDQN